MAYNKTTWVDRDVQYPNRFAKSGETSTQVTLTASAGTVTQEGTEVNATNLNKMEQGIKDAHDLVATAQTTADGKVNKSGDTMTGALTLSGNPTQNAHASNKAYVDAGDASLQSQITSLGTSKADVTYVDGKVTALVNGSPAALDTLNELATALGNDANFATTVTNNLATKAPLASPALTGTPTAPTATSGTNTTQIATTAFVQDAVTNLPAGSVTTSEIADGSVTAAKLDPNLPTSVGLGQLQTQVDGKVSKAGDTMTGHLTLNANPTSNLHAATKQYVDSAVGSGGNYAVKDGTLQTNLNADLLDGQHGSYYATASSVTAKADITYVDAKTVKGQITTDTTSWVSSTGTGNFAYKKSIAITGITTSDYPDVRFTVGTYQVASVAGISYVETYAGGITLYATAIPTASVTFDYVIVKG